ncbi:MAG: amidohydrolase family protein [bacterium]
MAALIVGSENLIAENTNQQAWFDVHLHYDARDRALCSPEQILEVLVGNGVQHALITSNPPTLALELAAHSEGRVLPMLGVYDAEVSKTNWWSTTDLPKRVERLLQLGDWAAIGELHLFADQRHSTVFHEIIVLGEKYQLPVMLHADPAVIDEVFRKHPNIEVIWAHAGKYPYPALLADYLDRYPRLTLDLSMRAERIASNGEIDPDWESFLSEYSSRLMIGVDTYRSSRWLNYGYEINRFNLWLDDLSASDRDAISYGNAARLFEAAISGAQ